MRWGGYWASITRIGPVDPETLELRLDEAILKETPQLEKRQSGIKVLAAVAPLLGSAGHGDRHDRDLPVHHVVRHR